MAKQKIIKKMNILGFIGFIIMSTIGSLFAIVLGALLFIPFINVQLMGEISGKQDVYNHLWDFCKTKYKIVKETKIKVTKQVLEKV